MKPAPPSPEGPDRRGMFDLLKWKQASYHQHAFESASNEKERHEAIKWGHLGNPKADRKPIMAWAVKAYDSEKRRAESHREGQA